MRVLAYGKGSAENVLEVVESVVSREDIEVCGDLQCLSAKLRKTRDPLDEKALVIILVPANRDDLREILSIQPLLQNARTIVVAPNQETETVAMAHMLRPRFLTYAGEDPCMLTAVLHKIAARKDIEGVQDRRSLPRG
jgi:hypothetical protein